MPSFDVLDLDTVDREVLGANKFGPHDPEMGRKLSEMNTVVEDSVRQLPSDTLLLVFGDHRMTSRGNHGGDIDAEQTTSLFVYSPGLGSQAHIYCFSSSDNPETDI